MGSDLFKSLFDHAVEFHKLHHQTLFAVICRREDAAFSHFSAACPVFIQDRFDPHNGIQDIGACISFKGCKFIRIEDIILRCLIGKVTVFHCGERHQLRGLHRLIGIHFMVFSDLLIHLCIDVRDQCLKAHHAAFPCLEGLSVFSVHGAESQKAELCIIFYQFCLAGAAEYLSKMHLLAFVHHIDDLIRMEQLHTFDDGSKVCGSIEGSSV